LRIQRQLPHDDNAALGSVVTEIAIALREQGRMEESDGYFAEGLEILRRAQGQRSVPYAKLLVDLGRLEKLRSNPKQALKYLEEALQLTRKLKGETDREVGSILGEMSNVKVWSDDLEGAEVAARAAVEIYKSAPEGDPDRVMADYYLADILFFRGRTNDSAALFERALAAQRHLYGTSSRAVADTLTALAQVRIAQGNLQESEKLIREALAIHQDFGSTAHLQIGYLQTMLATVEMRQRRFSEAEQELRDTLVLFAKNIPRDHQYVASAEHYLGEALLAQSKFGDAEIVLTAATERWKRSGAPEWRSARSASALGEALNGLGRTDEAERYLVDSYRELSSDPGADYDTKRIARERVSKFYTALGQREKLNTLLLEAGGGEARQSSAKSTPSSSGG
jgi:tetratricopeptide (TPR) repeat protein